MTVGLTSVLDTYLNFISNCIVIAATFVMRRLGIIGAKHIDGLQMAAFTLSLPAFLLQSIWMAELNPDLFVIIPVVLTVSAMSMACVSAGVRFAPERFRGLYSMALTGNSMSYVLPAVIQSSRFGTDCAPTVLIWELGGNIWVSTLFYGVSAVIYSPLGAESEPTIENETRECCDQLGRGSGVVVESLPASIGVPLESRCAGSETLPTSQNDIDLDAVQSASPTQSPPNVGQVSHNTVPVGALQCREVMWKISKIPMLWGALLGLLLNLLHVPRYDFPCKAINNVASTFSVLLYVLLGANIRFDIGIVGYRHVASMLLIRWTAAAFFILFMRTFLPLDATKKGVVTLCLMGPVSTPFVMYVMRHNHPLGPGMMVYNVSALASVLAINLLEPIV